MRAFYAILFTLLICNCGGGDSSPPTSEETDAGPQISCGPNTTLVDNVCWSKDEACDGEDDDGDGETDEGCPNWDEINITLHCDEGFVFENGECIPSETPIQNECEGLTTEDFFAPIGNIHHCGGCNIGCDYKPYMSVACTFGNCAYNCLENFIDLDHDEENGCECLDEDGDDFVQPIQGCQPPYDNPDLFDCDDYNAAIYPGAPEICDDRDNNCDGQINEGCPDLDEDNDGYSPFDGDCDDNDPNVNPGAIDWCDQLNNDCDDQMNEDDPNLGHFCTTILNSVPVQGTYVCGEGGLVCAPPVLEECQQQAEICDNNGLDDNCDGQVDEGCDPLSCETDDDCGAGGGCGCDLNGNFACSGQSGLCVDGVCETSGSVTECELGCNELGCLSECEQTPTGQAEPGDVVKGTFDALYFISQESYRYVVPNETMFLSWHYDNSCVKTITDQELADIPLAANVCMRYGTHLVKIQSIPIVYAVSTNCDIYKIADEQSALELFGTNWQDRIYDVPDAFWPNYSIIGIDLFGGWYPDGFVLKVVGSDDVYLIWNGQKRLFASDQAFIDNHFQERFITETTQATLDFYPYGPDITGCEPDLVDDSQGGGGVCL